MVENIPSIPLQIGMGDQAVPRRLTGRRSHLEMDLSKKHFPEFAYVLHVIVYLSTGVARYIGKMRQHYLWSGIDEEFKYHLCGLGGYGTGFRGLGKCYAKLPTVGKLSAGSRTWV